MSIDDPKSQSGSAQNQNGNPKRVRPRAAVCCDRLGCFALAGLLLTQRSLITEQR